MNHCIREYTTIVHGAENSLMYTPAVLDLVEVLKDELAFIVMEEWPAPLTTSVPANLGEYLNFLRYCIEVKWVWFMALEFI